MPLRRSLAVGVAYAAPGFVVTFVPDHSLRLGLWLVVTWAAASVAARLFVDQSIRLRPVRNGLVLGVLAGLASAAALALGKGEMFTWIIGLWALSLGASELFSGPDSDRFAGVLTLAFGTAQLIMPLNPVVNVGLFGAYLAVMGVWTIIGELSPDATPQREGAPEHG
ncbi:MAG TPA: hypothetical protein VK139_01350 [Microbacteriaceae bacterium]|nr:hypothetical protein [Microbacteriaceae bacterium]